MLHWMFNERCTNIAQNIFFNLDSISHLNYSYWLVYSCDMVYCLTDMCYFDIESTDVYCLKKSDFREKDGTALQLFLLDSD